MVKHEPGTPLIGEMPNPQSKGLNPTSYNNCSAKLGICKPPSSTSFGVWERAAVVSQLKRYLSLGLVPIPLKDKKPLLRWKEWNPKTIKQLERYINPTVNWGVKTGPDLTVIDFDTSQAFADFIVKNLEKLPDNTPIVKTGRGYHIWLKPEQEVRNKQFKNIDIKATGGYVVAPPSVHSNGTRYRFIKPLGDSIPKIDMDELDFPKVRNEHQAQPHAKGGDGNSGVIGEKRSQEEWDDIINNGVGVGSRHSTLVSYIGYLLYREGALLDDLLELTAEWNQRNHQPLPEEEVEATVRDCWSRWGHPVPTKTLSKDSVIVGTRDRTDELVEHKPEFIDEGAWATEVPINPLSFCGRKRRIVRKGRNYVTVSFFCGRWDCPRCSAFFRKRWTSHLLEVTEGQDVYTLKCGEEDWGRVRRGINRLRADYVRIATENGLTIILNKQHPESRLLLSGEVQGFLEATIPAEAETCPISTSRGWEQHRNTKQDTGYKLVTETWLPLSEQIDVARSLGATINIFAIDHWTTPEEADESQWESEFIKAIRSREEKILIMTGDKYEALSSYLSKADIDSELLTLEGTSIADDARYLTFGRN